MLSRRMSQSIPLARMFAPDRPYDRPISAGMTPIPRDARLEDLVADEQVLHLDAELAHALHHALRLVDPSLGEVVLQAADAVEVRVEAPSGDRFDLVEHELAVAERIERGGHRTELQAHLPEEEADVGDARHLEEDRADPLRAGRGLDVHQLLGGEDERHLVGEARQPVDPVDQRGDLRIRADLDELLVAAVHVAHHRIGGHDLLAVEAHDDAQGPVRGGMLRAEVEGHALGLELDIDSRVGRLPGDVLELLTFGDGGHSGERRPLRHHPALRQAWARRRRSRATASPPAAAVGSLCAAGNPRTPSGDRCGPARGDPRS